MSNTSEISIKLRLDDKGVVQGFRQIGTESDRTGKKGKQAFRALNQAAGMTKNTLLKMGAGVAGLLSLTAAYSKLKAAANEYVQLATVQEDAENKLAAVLEATGHAAGYNVEQLKKLASQLQEVTRFGDETTLSAMAVLATFRQIKGDEFKQATELAMDMSIVLKQDLNSSILQIGKALNAPILGMTALSRSGVQFTADQKELAKTLVENGDILAAQKMILQELEKEFSGTAKAAVDNFRGQLVQAQNAAGDFKEELGFLITKNRLYVEVIKESKEQFQDWTKYIQEHQLPIMQNVIVWTARTIKGISYIIDAVALLRRGWELAGAASDTFFAVLKEECWAAADVMINGPIWAAEHLIKLYNKIPALPDIAMSEVKLGNTGRKIKENLELASRAVESGMSRIENALKRPLAGASMRKGIDEIVANVKKAGIKIEATAKKAGKTIINTAGEAANKANEVAKKARQEDKKAMDGYITEYKRLTMDKYAFEEYQANQWYEKEKKLRQGQLTALAALEKLHNAQLDDIAKRRTQAEYEALKKRLDKEAAEHNKQVQETQGAYDNMFTSVQDHVYNFIDDWKSAGHTLVDIAKKTVKEIAAAFITQKIVMPIALQVGSQMGLNWGSTPMQAMMGQGGQGIPGLTGNPVQMLGKIGELPGMGFVGDALGWTLPGTGAQSVAVALPTGTPVNLTASGTVGGVQLGTALGYGFMGSMGYSMLADPLGLPTSEYSSLTAGFGSTAIGEMMVGAIAGPLGIALGALIGGVIGGKLGHEDTPEFGIRNSARENGDIEEIWSVPERDVIRSKYRYSPFVQDMGDKRPLAEEIHKYFEQRFSVLDDAIDASLSDIIDSRKFDIRIGADVLKEKGLPEALKSLTGSFMDKFGDIFVEEITKQHNVSAEVFNEDFFQAIAPDGDMIAAFARFDSVMDETANASELLTKRIEEQGMSAVEAFTQIEAVSAILKKMDADIAAMGQDSVLANIEAISTAWDTYIKAMQEANATVEQLTKAEKDRNLVLGANITGVNVDSIANALQTGTDVGQIMAQTLGGLLNRQMAEQMFDEMKPALEEAGQVWEETGGNIEAVRQSLIDAGYAIDELGESFKDVADSAEYLADKQRLEMRILKLQGNEEEIIARQRQAEIDKLTKAYGEASGPLIEMVNSIYDMEAAGQKSEQANKAAAIEASKAAEASREAARAFNEQMQQMQAYASAQSSLMAKYVQALGGDGKAFARHNEINGLIQQFGDAAGPLVELAKSIHQLEDNATDAMKAQRQANAFHDLEIKHYESIGEKGKALTLQREKEIDQYINLADSLGIAGSSMNDFIDRVLEITDKTKSMQNMAKDIAFGLDVRKLKAQGKPYEARAMEQEKWISQYAGLGKQMFDVTKNSIETEIAVLEESIQKNLQKKTAIQNQISANNDLINQAVSNAGKAANEYSGQAREYENQIDTISKQLEEKEQAYKQIVAARNSFRNNQKEDYIRLIQDWAEAGGDTKWLSREAILQEFEKYGGWLAHWDERHEAANYHKYGLESPNYRQILDTYDTDIFAREEEAWLQYKELTQKRIEELTELMNTAAGNAAKAGQTDTASLESGNERLNTELAEADSFNIDETRAEIEKLKEDLQNLSTVDFPDYEEAAKEVLRLEEQERFLAAERDLSLRVIQAQGNTEASLSMQRQQEMDDLRKAYGNMSGPLEDLLKQLWEIEDYEKLLTAKRDLTLRILQAQGDTEGALALQRSIDLENLRKAYGSASGSLETMLQALWQVEDMARAKEQRDRAAQEYLSKLEEERGKLEQRRDKAKAEYLSLLHDELTVQKDLAGELENAIRVLREYRRELYTSEASPFDLMSRKSILSGKIDELKTKSISGDADAMSKLPGTMREYLDIAKKTSGSWVDYARDVAHMASFLKNIEDSGASSVSKANLEIEMLNETIETLEMTDQRIEDIGNARRRYESAQAALENSWYGAEITRLEGLLGSNRTLVQLSNEFNYYQHLLDQTTRDSNNGINHLRGLSEHIGNLQEETRDEIADIVPTINDLGQDMLDFKNQASTDAQSQESCLSAIKNNTVSTYTEIANLGQYRIAHLEQLGEARNSKIHAGNLTTTAIYTKINDVYLRLSDLSAIKNNTVSTYTEIANLGQYRIAHLEQLGAVRNTEIHNGNLVVNAIRTKVDGIYSRLGLLSSIKNNTADTYTSIYNLNQHRMQHVADLAVARNTMLSQIVSNTASKGSFANGGIASGPKSGYSVTLHGTELIVPMNNGKVPVELRNMSVAASIPKQARSADDYLIEEIRELRVEVRMFRKEQSRSSTQIITNTSQYAKYAQEEFYRSRSVQKKKEAA